MFKKIQHFIYSLYFAFTVNYPKENFKLPMREWVAEETYYSDGRQYEVFSLQGTKLKTTVDVETLEVISFSIGRHSFTV